MQDLEPPNRRRSLATLAAALVLGWLPALFSADSLRAVVAMRGPPDAARPFLELDHPWLPYFWAPVVVASGVLLVLSPGIVLAVALGQSRRLDRWLPAAIGLSLVSVGVLAQVVQSALHAPLTGARFEVFLAATTAAAAAVVALRMRRGFVPELPATGRALLVSLALLLVPLWLLHAAFVPKIYWENFSGDGAGAFESGRLLLHQSLPFYDPRTQIGFPGLNTMVNPVVVSFFIRMFGDVEASSRVHFLLALAALYAVITGLAEHATERRLGGPQRALLWLGLAVVAVTNAFSATYDPYSADLGMPGSAPDLLHLSIFLAFALAFLRGERVAMIAFLLLAYVSSAGGLLIIGMFVVAAVVGLRPRPWRDVAIVAAAAVACAGATLVLPKLIHDLGLPPPGREHSFDSMFGRMRYVQWSDWRRIAYTAIPCGLAPMVAIAAWRSHDRVARTFALLWAAAFAWFYLQAVTNLHYFVPTMVLPLVVLWRSPRTAGPSANAGTLAAVAGAGLLAIVVSLPARLTVPMDGRSIGSTIDIRDPGYDTCDAAAELRCRLLFNLFPADWDPRVPGQTYGGSPRAWTYYAHHSERPPSEINYVLQPDGDAAPPGMQLLASADGGSLFVRDAAVWAAQAARRPPTPPGARVYWVERNLMFNHRAGADPRSIDWKSHLSRQPRAPREK